MRSTENVKKWMFWLVKVLNCNQVFYNKVWENFFHSQQSFHPISSPEPIRHIFLPEDSSRLGENQANKKVKLILKQQFVEQNVHLFITFQIWLFNKKNM